MKNGTYKDAEGNSHKIVDFDEANKMVYVEVSAGQFEWRHDYQDWVIEGEETNDTAEAFPDSIDAIEPEVVEESEDEIVPEDKVEEKPKPKKTTVKKTTTKAAKKKPKK